MICRPSKSGKLRSRKAQGLFAFDRAASCRFQRSVVPSPTLSLNQFEFNALLDGVKILPSLSIAIISEPLHTTIWPARTTYNTSDGGSGEYPRLPPLIACIHRWPECTMPQICNAPAAFTLMPINEL